MGEPKLNPPLSSRRGRAALDHLKSGWINPLDARIDEAGNGWIAHDAEVSPDKTLLAVLPVTSLQGSYQLRLSDTRTVCRGGDERWGFRATVVCVNDFGRPPGTC